jgi:predicted  nucleic acid-binding Zn-ribbon protein
LNDTISALYGQTDAVDEPKQRLLEVSAKDDFEIRSQGKNFAKIKVGAETVEVPRARYVKDLETELERLDKELKKAYRAIRQLTNAANRTSTEIADLKKQMKNKLDRFD